VKPRNILLLWTDQQRPDTIAALGDRNIRTPALDQLANSSCVFSQSYAAEPVCTPSRATVLTGLYPHTHGLVTNGHVLNPSIPTLAELLQPAGYACGYVGKWHLGNEVKPQRGFEKFWSGTEDRYTDDASKGRSAYHDFLVSRGYIAPNGGTITRDEAVTLPEAVGKPAFQAQECIRFLETYRDGPFFLSCNFLEPHHPYFGPFNDLYRPEDMTLPDSWYENVEPTVPLRFRLRREYYVEGWAANTLPAGFTDEELQWKTAKAWYWGQVSLVDKYAGLILQRLEELGLAEDTVVVYTSDHGDMMGEHHMHQKGMPFEGSSRVPLMIRAPGLSAQRLETPVSTVHIVPTVLDLIGQPLPSHLQGTSLRPLLERGDTAPEDTDVVIEWSGPFAIQRLDRLRAEGHLEGISPDDPRLTEVKCRTIRRGHWKLTLHASGEHELYNLAGDPGEQHNAFFDSGVQDVILSLTQRLQEWQRVTNDDFVLPDPALAR
jgi:arylsulfatase A-like enzyme